MEEVKTEEQKAAEEWCQARFGHIATDFGNTGKFTPNPTIEAFLAGIEWERKRLADKMNGPYGLGPVEPETYAGRERWRDTISDMVRRLSERRHAEKEGLIAEYLVAHPEATIDDVELVEVREGCAYRWFVRPKTNEPVVHAPED